MKMERKQFGIWSDVKKIFCQNGVPQLTLRFNYMKKRGKNGHYFLSTPNPRCSALPLYSGMTLYQGGWVVESSQI